MKLSMEFSEADLRNAVAEYLKARKLEFKEVSISFTIHEADDDPRSHRPAYVTASVECS